VADDFRFVHYRLLDLADVFPCDREGRALVDLSINHDQREQRLQVGRMENSFY